MKLLFWSTLKLFENAFLIQFEQMRMDQKRIFEQFESGSKSKFEQFWFTWLFFSKSNPNWNMEHRLIFTWFLVDILWKLILTTEMFWFRKWFSKDKKCYLGKKFKVMGRTRTISENSASSANSIENVFDILSIMFYSILKL